ncbi:MCE-family protein [Patulibacter medicamentivorans]|uniref:MCE-family protein n=1 Tax=Patulibacter medicamentivorans TaxID=1097667 RepID=H0E6M9_9ACTN|nr:MlaD family protein [Patulibacter medicamentivorans]EHN10676.1 MCE-family protein [Patulibacter medicamentivorans]
MQPADSRPLALRAGAIALLALAVIAAAALLLRGREDHGRTLRAAFQEAVQVVPGQEVRVAGRKVGRVGAVREVDGDAVVDLEIDAADWPLHRGTTARLRYGSVSGYAARFVELRPGPSAGPTLPTGGVLGTSATVTPVEFDQIFNGFDAATRRNLRGVLDEAADTVDGRGPSLARALRQGSRGLDGYADLVTDLGSDPAALRLLVHAGARTSGALRRQDTALRALLRRAAGTFDELGARAAAQRAALDRLPPTLSVGRRTLGTLDHSLVGLRALVADLGPGARALRDVAPAVERTTGTLLDVAPLATSTLDVGTATAPGVERLLRAGTPFLPRLATTLDQLAPMAACLRPYGPEIAGMASTWTGFSGVDAQGGYGRVDLTQLPPLVAAGTVLDSNAITSVFRDRVFYAMPRPPGLDAGQPWFLPECGAGPDALDPSKDPERGGGG